MPATPKTESVRVDSRFADEARTVLGLHGVGFTERKPFPWVEVEFTVSGLTWQVDAAMRALRRLDATNWWDDQW